MIMDFLHYTEDEDVNSKCTSIEWIWTYLQQHYNIELKGVHFMRISKVVPNSDEPHQAFYRRLRQEFSDNLRKSGDRILYNDELLTEMNKYRQHSSKQ